MESSFSIVAIILILGITQGLFLTMLLFNKPDNKKANRILAVLIITYSTFIIESSISGMQIAKQFPHILGLTAGVVYLHGPLHYLYARSLISSNILFSKKDTLHLIPFCVFYLYFLFPFYLKSGAYKISFFQSIEQNGPTLALIFFSWVVLFQGLFYMLVTFKLLKKHSANIKAKFSSLENINLNWLKRITFMTMIVWILGIIIEFLQLFDLNAGVQSTVPISITILIYAMGYLGLRQSEIFDGRNEADTKELKKYEHSGLTKEMSKSIHEKLIELMTTKKLFTDSNLKLNQLAHLVATSPNYLSQVINEQRQQNFYDFINSFRIEEAKNLITDPSHKNENLLFIAYNVGFNSKSAFNTAFKKYTGKTPTQYRNNASQ